MRIIFLLFAVTTRQPPYVNLLYERVSIQGWGSPVLEDYKIGSTQRHANPQNITSAERNNHGQWTGWQTLFGKQGTSISGVLNTTVIRWQQSAFRR